MVRWSLKVRKVQVGRVCHGAYCVLRIPSSRYAIRNTEYESRRPGREAFSSVSARGGPPSDCFENNTRRLLIIPHFREAGRVRNWFMPGSG